MKRQTILSATAALAAAAMITSAHAQEASDTGYITAGIIVHEIKTLGYAATVDQDDSGDPRVNTAVDGHKWQIYFYDCGQGALADRHCQSFQFFADNSMPKPVPAQTINRWNKEYRYAKAYLQQGNNPGCPAARSCAARIEIDVLMDETGADPAKTFRAYFSVMKRRADGFRKFIGAP
jgi:putative sensory transduction regulator